MSAENLANIIEALEELGQDSTVQKNIKAKLAEVIKTLNSDEDISIKINKALDELDQISNDNNIHTYARTQIWNAVSMLEMIQV